MFRKLEFLYEITGFIQNTSVVTMFPTLWIILATSNEDYRLKAIGLLMGTFIVLAAMIYCRELIVEKARPLYEAMEDTHYGECMKY